MANSFGSLWVGASGIQSASNGLNTTANNLSNVNTDGYVREQVVYEDRDYRKVGTAAVSTQQAGLGVDVGTIVHARDIFLDKAYRTENGRCSFYQASADAVDEVQTQLQETNGEEFKEAITDFYEAFGEFAKDPSDTVNQNLVLQKASLFLSRATAVDDGFEDYQSIINSKIKEDVNRINEIGKEIVKYNKQIQAIEAADVEQAMDLRDKRDLLLDELSGMVRISYDENPDGIVKVDIEGVEFIDEVRYNEIGMEKDLKTGYLTPYWTYLSDFTDEDNPEYYYVFDTTEVNGHDYLTNVSAEQNSDMGEIKALLMARGDGNANYRDYLDITSDEYDTYIGNSIMMNSEAELDTLIHQLTTTINDLFSPTDTFETVYEDDIATATASGTTSFGYMDEDGVWQDLTGKQVCDVNNADVGSDGELPPRELFVRNGCSRYEEVTLTDSSGNEIKDADGNSITVYVYNEEDEDDSSTWYSLDSIKVNQELIEQESLLPFKNYLDQTKVDYDLGDNLESMWTIQNFNLNPSDTTPTSFTEFYTKWIGEIGTVGNIYSTTASSLEGTTEQIEYSRQGVMGVSSDEELTSMIKYQNAYNAASRYVNVVNEMIEHLLNTLAS